MKRPVIISTVLLCSMYVLLGSNAAGPAAAGTGIRNGGPGGSGNCAGCHGGGAGTTTAAISLKEKISGTPAGSTYTPGKVYTVTISGNNTALAFFGFQVTAVKGSAQAGAFSNMSAGTHLSNIGGLQVAEQSSALAKVGGAYTTSFDWTAPATGTGTVTFHGIINGVNKDGGSGGDKTSDPVTLSLNEAPVTSIADPVLWGDLKLSPVPAFDVLHVSSEGIKAGTYALYVYDLNGKVLQRNSYTVKLASMETSIALSSLPAGTYFLSITSKDSKVSRMFTKR